MNRSLAANSALAAASITCLLFAHECLAANTDPGPGGANGIFDASNVVLVNQLGLGDFGVNLSSGADCWGYTSPGGREYAIMTADAMVAFVEITDPANPVIIQVIPHPTNLWCDVKVINQHAYVSTELSGGSIQIIDLSNIDSGNVQLVGTISDTGVTRAHNVVVDNLGQRLYLCGARNGGAVLSGGGLLAFDVSNPVNPQFLGAYDQSYLHDAQVHIFDSGPNANKAIAFCFVEDRGIDIVDITDPTNAVRLSRTTYTGIAYSHQGWFDPTTNLLYQNDELDENNGNVSVTTTRIFDCTDLTNPQLVGTYTTGLPSIDHNLYIKDGFIYHANYRSGMRIFDTSANPIAPTEVGYFDTYPSSDAVDFSGAWSAYPYFDSGLVIISDFNRGLFITDPTYAISGGIPFAYQFPTPLPEILPETGSTYTFQINDTNGAVDPNNVWFSYANTTSPPPAAPRDAGHMFTTIQATSLGGGNYEAQFPAAACGDILEYYFSAFTLDGLAVISPFSSPIVGIPSKPFIAVYADQLVEVIADDFETDLSWSVGDPSDTATTGIWERVDPIGTVSGAGAQIQPEFDNSPDPGTLCFVTGQQPIGNTGIGTNDIDGGATTLISPLIDASVQGVAFLQYAIWYVNDGNATIDDVMLVEISNDDGGSWFEVETFSTSTAGWESKSIAISDILTPTDMMRVRFIASDGGSGSIVEAAIDDFAIEITQCSPGLPADINGDGVVDTADLGILLGLFGTSDPQADLNNDGVVDTADLGILLSAFGSGA